MAYCLYNSGQLRLHTSCIERVLCVAKQTLYKSRSRNCSSFRQLKVPTIQQSQQGTASNPFQMQFPSDEPRLYQSVDALDSPTVSDQDNHSINDARIISHVNSYFLRANDFQPDSLNLKDSCHNNDKDQGDTGPSSRVQPVTYTNKQISINQQEDSHRLQTTKGSFLYNSSSNIPGNIMFFAGDVDTTIAMGVRTLDHSNSNKLDDNVPNISHLILSHEKLLAMNPVSSKGSTDARASIQQPIEKEHGNTEPDNVIICAGNVDGSIAKDVGILEHTSCSRINNKELYNSDSRVPKETNLSAPDFLRQAHCDLPGIDLGVLDYSSSSRSNIKEHNKSDSREPDDIRDRHLSTHAFLGHTQRDSSCNDEALDYTNSSRSNTIQLINSDSRDPDDSNECHLYTHAFLRQAHRDSSYNDGRDPDDLDIDANDHLQRKDINFKRIDCRRVFDPG